jgi:lipopolysaccharide/colanic/teichoic acid biosynthesis glycosyltransferase
MTEVALTTDHVRERTPAKPVYHRAKRFADLVGALVLLTFGFPLFVLIGVLIRLDSQGPVLFRQERMGSRSRRIDGARVWQLEPFVFLKFRTMFVEADPSLHQTHIQAFVGGELIPTAGSKAAFKLDGDPRVTRMGRILRRLSLDELPQLINVVKGEMSLVGPRPVPLYEAAYYGVDHRARFAALPGITGLWQVRGRCDVSFTEMIDLDISYVRNQSMWLDTKILLLTIPAIIGGRGAG